MIKRQLQGGRGVALVAITYVYFLIFAQFGFLAHLAALGISGDAFKVVMASMAAGGILFSLLVPRAHLLPSPVVRLRIGLGLCAIAGLLSLLSLSVTAAACVAFLIGAGLGILTVTLVTHLRLWAGAHNPILNIGIGTGLGYLICNVPAVFSASPTRQAILASGLCVIGAMLASPAQQQPASLLVAQTSEISFPRVLISFAALVWLDSAAFYIIQHTPVLKAGTWMGNAHLWTNGCIHFMAAVLAALLLQRRRAPLLLAYAFGALGFACLLLIHPALILPASLFYPAGVSLYSVALVAYPSYLSGAGSDQQRARQAGWIYAIAGWIGSASGIGMGQNLGHVPPGFVFVAGFAVLLPELWHLMQARTREVVLLCAAFVIAYMLTRLPPADSAASASAIERGRQIYISEGCIHCHSQYVRPNTQDVLLWGPAETLQELHSQKPPLIGNRRQGPDLLRVGERRSPLWLKAHLIDPAQVSRGSIMPSYAFLFSGQRGDDLVAYLASLRSPGNKRQQYLSAWHIAESTFSVAKPDLGRQIYLHDCATCHDANGATRTRWQSSFRHLPPNLLHGPFLYLHPSESPQERMDHIAHIAKFGIPNTDMPGHEYLSDLKIASLSLWLAQHCAPPLPHSLNATGDAQ